MENLIQYQAEIKLALTAVVVILIFMAILLNKKNNRLKEQYNNLKKENDRHQRDNRRFQAIRNIESEVKELELKKNKLISQVTKEKVKIDELHIEFKNTEEQQQNRLNKLRNKVQIYEAKEGLHIIGVYDPIFSFEDSAAFKRAIMLNKDKQKALIAAKKACISEAHWELHGSSSRGSAMINNKIRMALRAFNGECDALIAKVKWNNIDTFIERINRSAIAINKLNKDMHVFITDKYINLRIEELRLTHEQHLKQQEERDEQARIREQIREEEKARKEYETEIRRAEKEEAKLAELLEIAKEKAEFETGAKMSALQKRIADLTSKLEIAQTAKERALSRAQLTKAGHVYIISNIGSFGEDVYKIGLTRRLEPLDRVRELGGASVPFKFDVHAMIYSDNAPELETTLHKIFFDKRVNKVNTRKEFFNVSLDEIQQEVEKLGHAIQFTLLAEAPEYRQSMIN